MTMNTSLEHSFLLGLSERLIHTGGIRVFAQELDQPEFFHELNGERGRLFADAEISALAQRVQVIRIVYDA